MAESTEIAGRMSEALSTAAQCSSAETVENYSHLAAQLQELESLAARSLRSHVDSQPILTKLQQGASLTPDELNTLRSLIVGDADQYLKYDDDFEEAKTELGKILDEIRALASPDGNLEFADASARAVPGGLKRARAGAALSGAEGAGA